MKDGQQSWPFFCPSCEHQYTKLGDPKLGADWAIEPIGMPVEYKNTIVDKIPCPKMRNVASTWDKWNDRSLLLHGTTRLGKTRAAWEVARRHWKNNYKKQTFITMRKFEKLIEEGFQKYDHSSKIDALINTPFLFIDDLGKERTTPRVACDLFAVIDERTINHRPTIITTNFNSSALLARFDDQELGAALIGRFRDYFDIVGATTEGGQP
jgi:DNA replication protein DnaC